MITTPGRSSAAVAAIACAVLLLAGILWIVITYATATAGPIPGIGNANLLIGFALMLLALPAGILAIVLAIIGKPKP